MIYLYLGTDKEKARSKMGAAIEIAATKTSRPAGRSSDSSRSEEVRKNAEIVRITDANTVEDLRTVLRGPGMFTPLEAAGSLTGFGGKRVLVFEGVCVNPELCEVLLESLEQLSKSEEDVFIYEEKPLADMRKKLEKYAERTEKYDAPKKDRDSSIFVMADALRAADKKALWVGYMREIAKGSAPEAIHGVLFWAAKDMLLRSKPANPEHARGRKLIASLAELPHAARRRGEDLEYALERFVLEQ